MKQQVGRQLFFIVGLLLVMSTLMMVLPGRIQAGLSDNGTFGFVGIGTDSPQRILHLVGNVALFERSVNSAGFIIKRTAALRYVFGVDDPTGFVIKTYPEGSGAVVRMTIAPDGSVTIPGTLSKGSGTFKIDHPLDPANKYLSHSFVESPDMLNVYAGNIVLDEKGQATVQMPSYFEALNRDFTYKLTCIGGYAPVYVAKEIAGNTFNIAGGEAGMKLSWQVTGIRQDPFALAHPVIVEQEKSAKEQGLYLHPVEYGLPESKGIYYSAE